MKVLDSDFLIALLRKDASVQNQLDKLNMSPEVIATTVFNAQEVLFGAMKSKNPSNLDVTKKLLLSLPILDYDLESVEHVVELTHFLEERGQRIGSFDEMIAGICLSQNATIVTRNIKHFSRVQGLRIESW